MLALIMTGASGAQAPVPRPNILWITSEDNGPHLGGYGDTYATTPNLDKLAVARHDLPERLVECAGLRARADHDHLRHVSHQHRLRAHAQHDAPAGEHENVSAISCARPATTAPTTSRRTTTSNKPGKVWDDSSNKAHWRNRKPGQPFFAVFNFVITHESQIRTRPHTAGPRSRQGRIPAYHPDTPEVRQDWAQYYDNITDDGRPGRRDAGRAGARTAWPKTRSSSIYGDHGSGMPRSKRWPYNSGLHVPLIVHIPEKFRQPRADGMTSRAATTRPAGELRRSGADAAQPGRHQASGTRCKGRRSSDRTRRPSGLRLRLPRTDGRALRPGAQRARQAIRLHPQLHAAQDLRPACRLHVRNADHARSGSSCTTRASCKPPQTYFWETKPPEELYDFENDPDEVNNLAGSPRAPGNTRALSKGRRDWELEIRDVGFLPEGEIHSRSAGSTPYEMAHDAKRYPLERILETAELASSLNSDALTELPEALCMTPTAPCATGEPWAF